MSMNSLALRLWENGATRKSQLNKCTHTHNKTFCEPPNENRFRSQSVTVHITTYIYILYAYNISCNNMMMMLGPHTEVHCHLCQTENNVQYDNYASINQHTHTNITYWYTKSLVFVCVCVPSSKSFHFEDVYFWVLCLPKCMLRQATTVKDWLVWCVESVEAMRRHKEPSLADDVLVVWTRKRVRQGTFTHALCNDVYHTHQTHMYRTIHTKAQSSAQSAPYERRQHMCPMTLHWYLW